MKAVNLIFKNAQQVKRELNAFEKKRVSAAQTAAKVEAFRLYKKLQGEVKAARPGGTKLAPLSQIARYTKTGKFKKNARRPLASLSRLVRYKAGITGGKYNVEVGFISPGIDAKGWRGLATVLQSGGQTLPSGSRAALRKRLLPLAIKLKKQRDPAYKFFFIRKTGPSTFKLPARQEIDPFWQVNKAETWRNIESNWNRKMMGERI